ncbi:MAG TPA: M24 family metallopeptidase [Solirubrobacteraceae bacterium]|nr:M24 family metallopeptidase [Solirubrobacteraceae bacterium]
MNRFSDGEMARRHDALAALMGDVDHVVVHGANRSGTAVGWLTRWPVTREAIVIVTPGERDVLYVGFYNHVPNAARIATEADVRWIGEYEPPAGRIGVIGRPARDGEVDLNAAYTQLRLVKSAEEIEWIRHAARLTDAGVAALREAARPGVSEYELGAAIEAAWLPHGATTHIHYLAATPMAAPELCVPAQWPSDRRLQAGDALVFEISASWWEYPAQRLGTIFVDAEPTPLYRDLLAEAEAVFDAVVARLRAGATAAELWEAAGEVTIRDDLVHGFVGGYLPPVLGARTPVPDFTFAAGMTVVVQPNVVTQDERAGVQVGELLLVTEQGFERLHATASPA